MRQSPPKSRGNELLPILSETGLARLYAERQAAKPTEGNRTPRNVALTTFMVLTLFTALFSLIWVQRSEFTYLESLSGVAIFEPKALEWKISRTPSCEATGPCIDALRSAPNIFIGHDLFEFDLARAKADGSATAALKISTSIDPGLWKRVAPETPQVPMIIALPGIRYEQAAVFVNGTFIRTFYNGEPLSPAVSIDPKALVPLHVEIALRPSEGQTVLLSVSPQSYIAFIAQQPRYQKYEDMIAAKRSGHGKQLADIARVVLAVFSLLLFIFVDSSPECLGLALFMGIKAIAVTFAQNWLPDWWTSSEANGFVRAFLLCFGDIIQFYFFVQLARVAKPNLKSWFTIGGALALVYATLTHLNLKTWDIDWNGHIWRSRNVIIGLCCMVTALSAARYCFKNKLYSRGAALLIATSGTIVQIVYPIVALYPSVFQTDWFKSLYHAFEMHTPYVFALSVFVNISTLENRVKSLSKELVNVKEIEREMALGRTVQQSFLHIPEIPRGMRVTCHHEAALYVSGDVYFVHWNEPRGILTMVVTDVTGHGVQAALKASIASALAEAIWSENQVRAGDEPGTKLAIYDQRLHSYLSKISRQDEVVSIVGGEFNPSTRVCTFYRVNGVYPIVLEPTPHLGAAWRVNVLPLKSRVVTEVPMPAGGFVLYISDGYIDSSRTLADFQKYMTDSLRSENPEVGEDRLKEIVLGYQNFARTNDDKTLLLFRCDGPRALEQAA